MSETGEAQVEARRRDLDRATDALQRLHIPIERYDDTTKLIELGIGVGYALLSERVEAEAPDQRDAQTGEEGE